jgi:hypothetical protein
MTTDTSTEAVERYFLSYHHTQTYAEMLPDCDGDWVRYSDYAALAAERDALRTEALDWRGQVGELSDQVKALRADNDRLRGALKKISHRPDQIIWGEGGEVRCAMRDMEEIADAALDANP